MPGATVSTAARRTSTVVQRWLDAGLVVFGKTSTPEFGSKGVTEPTLFGPTRNPWDPGRTPGGSSGGAAAAVAAGIVPVAAAMLDVLAGPDEVSPYLPALPPAPLPPRKDGTRRSVEARRAPTAQR